MCAFGFASAVVDFANSSAGGKFVTAAGHWLDSPVAVLKASDGSTNTTSALLALSEPHYDSTANTLTFKVRGSLSLWCLCLAPCRQHDRCPKQCTPSLLHGAARACILPCV